MPPRFAALEDRLTAAVFKHLSNTVAVLGGVEVSGVFDNAFVDAGGLGAYGTAPVFTCATASLAAVSVGDAATINGTAYTIVGMEPDGTGVSVVRLERT